MTVASAGSQAIATDRSCNKRNLSIYVHHLSCKHSSTLLATTALPPQNDLLHGAAVLDALKPFSNASALADSQRHQLLADLQHLRMHQTLTTCTAHAPVLWKAWKALQCARMLSMYSWKRTRHWYVPGWIGCTLVLLHLSRSPWYLCNPALRPQRRGTAAGAEQTTCAQP